MSEVDWPVGRVKLYELWRENPQRKHSKLAEAVGFSVSWVEKWLGRFTQANPDDVSIFFSQSRARYTLSKKVTTEVEEAILDIRDNPPDIPSNE